jgi:hypothetical protein
MSKADLYKHHTKPENNPSRRIDPVVDEYGGFTNYYNELVDSPRYNNRRIRKKLIHQNSREEKLEFYSGKL